MIRTLVALCLLAMVAAKDKHILAHSSTGGSGAHDHCWRNENEGTGKAASWVKNFDEAGDMGKAVLWIAFFGLFLPTIYFAFETFRMPEDKRKYHVITFGVTCIASLAYLTMATGHGSYIRPFGDCREFFYARYVDWAFTTPLQLLDILGFAGAGADVTSWLLGVDFLMIIAGLIGAFVDGNEKFYFWAFGMCMFAPILYALLVGLKASAANKSAACQSVFTKISLLTAISWTAYPLVWVLAEGEEIISPDMEGILYTVLDILAKSVFGFLIISARDACNEV